MKERNIYSSQIDFKEFIPLQKKGNKRPLKDMHSFSGGREWGYLDNTKHFIFGLCNMKQLNFRHFNTNTKKNSLKQYIFFLERIKNGSIKANIIFFSISRSFPPFYDNSGLFQIPEGHRRFPKTVEDFRRLTKTSDRCRRCTENPPNT